MKLINYLKENYWLNAAVSGFIGAVIADVWGLAKLSFAAVVTGVNWQVFYSLFTNPAESGDWYCLITGVMFAFGYFVSTRRNNSGFDRRIAIQMFMYGSAVSVLCQFVAMLLFASTQTMEIFLTHSSMSVGLAATVGLFLVLGETIAIWEGTAKRARKSRLPDIGEAAS